MSLKKTIKELGTNVSYTTGVIDEIDQLSRKYEKYLLKIVKEQPSIDVAIDIVKSQDLRYYDYSSFDVAELFKSYKTKKNWGDEFVNNALFSLIMFIFGRADNIRKKNQIIDVVLIKRTDLYKAAVKAIKRPARKVVKKPAKKSSKKAAKKSSKKAAKKSSKKTGRGYDALKVVELRARAKERGLSGYSRLKKGELVELLRGKAAKKAVKKPSRKPASKKEMTVVELKALCKKKGIKGYSRLNKAALIKLCKK